MSERLRAAVPFAVVAALLAGAEVVWVLAFLDRSSDGPAFAMALATVVLVPTLLVTMCAIVIGVGSRWRRAAAVAAVAASGFAAAGVEAGVFIGDDPTDPAFIDWVAALPLFALIAAVLLVGVVVWGPLRLLPSVARIVVTAVTAIVGPVLVAFTLLTAIPLVMLLALAAPVVLAIIAIVATRQRRRHLAT